MNSKFKFMRIILFFDLSTITSEDTRKYNKFMKLILKEGYIREQFSIYSKLAINAKTADDEKRYIYKICNVNGLVQVLIITEKQYASIEYITGKKQTKYIQSTDKIIYL
jgi:CRISPR-associated protein Cas2